MTDRPCRTTQHCAVHGFCHRCDQKLTDASKLVVKAIPAAGIPDTAAGAAYATVMKVLMAYADSHGQITVDEYGHRSDCTGCSGPNCGPPDMHSAEGCTCASAGDAFVPAEHYRDCPQYAADECVLPAFMECNCDHATGCQHPRKVP